MLKFRRSFLSLLLMMTMALTAIGATNASASMPCTGIMPGMASKSDPCAPKAPECMDMSGCILAAAKLTAPLELQRLGFWSVGAYAASSATVPASAIIRPDHSPPRHIA